MRVIVGITGASGAIYGIRLLEELAARQAEIHLVVSRWGWETIRMETDCDARAIEALATFVYREDDLSAPISSGSFRVDAMAVVPCSMKTVAAIAHGYSNDLISRAATVRIKERGTLVVVPREAPLSPIHLENLLCLARLGVVVLPPMPAFYNRPTSVRELVDHTVGRVLDQLGIEHNLVKPWDGGGYGRTMEP